MKIYRCDFSDPFEGTLVSWHPSKQAAYKHLQEQQKQRGDGESPIDEVKAVEIPTDKTGLIQWLNTYLKTDND